MAIEFSIQLLTKNLVKEGKLATDAQPEDLLKILHASGMQDMTIDSKVSVAQMGKILAAVRAQSASSGAASAKSTSTVSRSSSSSSPGVTVRKKRSAPKRKVVEIAESPKVTPVAKKPTSGGEDKVEAKAKAEKPAAKEPAKDQEKPSTESQAAPADIKKDEKVDYRAQREARQKKRTLKKQKKKYRTQAAQQQVSDIEQGFSKPTLPLVREVAIPEAIAVHELAARMSIKPNVLIGEVFKKLGAMITINQMVDQETAELIVREFDHVPKLLSSNQIEESIQTEEEMIDAVIESRAPVVTIMGHVDHGKTSLLDYIRRAKVTSTEAGGITQHIGAYHVDTDKGSIAFLDTPGHEAFTAMRARGAKCTDIVILVVAADSGAMPQTVEAINHAKAAEVPLVVAINKMDLETADPEKIKKDLSQHGVISEEWGGENIFVPISAKTGDGVDALLDAILLQAEVLELKARVDGPARGVVVESRLDKGRGPVATVLVAAGSLSKGDIVVAGREFGRVRAMLGDDGAVCKQAGPSMPVEILGLSGTPSAGDEVISVATEKKAREITQFRQGKYREVRLAKKQSASLENLFKNVGQGKQEKLNIVLKADVQGSMEAIIGSLSKISTDEVKVNFVTSAVGGITESDVNLALASQAIIIGFNVRADGSARALVEREGVDLRYYSIIYNLIDEVKSAMSGLLSPRVEEKIVGLAEVRDVFRSSKLGAIAGCLVQEGAVKRKLPIRVLRDNVVIFEGELESLRRFKDDTEEVRSGTECGIGVKNYNDVKAGDQIECFERYEVDRTL
jgi:translation initiation factor IF-2